MVRYLILLGLLNLVHLSEICKTLQVSTNLKKSQDDIISQGVTSKQWSRKAKNPIIVLQRQKKISNFNKKEIQIKLTEITEFENQKNYSKQKQHQSKYQSQQKGIITQNKQ